jgi:hypothetical protein
MAGVRRDARAQARRRKAVVTASVVVLATVVLGFGALLASDALRLEGGPGPALAEHMTTSTTRDDAERDRRCRGQITPVDPLRLWIAGDSLAGSLGPSLGERAAATGIVQPVYDARVSSGLSEPDFFDWPQHAAAEIARLDPDVVVFIVGANDWKVPGEGPSWSDEYRLQVEQMLRVLEGGSDTRHVYWVGSPTMQERRKDQGVQQVNVIARQVVGDHDRATFVDAYELFSDDDADGGYTSMLPGSDGKDVRVRAGDGIHLTAEGGDLLGDAVFAQLDSRCHLVAQAVPDQPKTVERTRGSDGPTSTPGGSSSGGSGGAGSSVTTVPAAPPVTDPPAPEPVPVPEPEPEPDPPPETPPPPSEDLDEPVSP